MSRRQRSVRTPAQRPTYRKILDQAMVVLSEDGFDRFSVQRVLDGASVSRATLYRYFPDVDGLIEAALVEVFSREVDQYLALARGLVERAPDFATFRDELRNFLQAFSTVPVLVRLRRTHTIVLASTRPELAVPIASIQESLNDGWDEALKVAQRRGFLRSDLDTRAVAVIIQSVGLGRIVDDAAVSHVSNERWAQTFFEFLDQGVLARPT